MPVFDAVEHLVGLQAQEPLEPYVGLWSRLRDFRPDELGPLHQSMLVTRMVGTLRCRPAGPWISPSWRRRRAGRWSPRSRAPSPRSAARWPGAAPRDLGDALSSLVPLVQVPPRDLGTERPGAQHDRRDLARPGTRRPAPPADALVRRYLAACGPAAGADIRAWSGLSGLRDAVERLRTFRDERGRELLDVADARSPTPTCPPRRASCRPSTTRVDGRVAATWAVDRDGATATPSPRRARACSRSSPTTPRRGACP